MYATEELPFPLFFCFSAYFYFKKEYSVGSSSTGCKVVFGLGWLFFFLLYAYLIWKPRRKSVEDTSL